MNKIIFAVATAAATIGAVFIASKLMSKKEDDSVTLEANDEWENADCSNEAVANDPVEEDKLAEEAEEKAE